MTAPGARSLVLAMVLLLAACGPSAEGPSADPSPDLQPTATPSSPSSDAPSEEPSAVPEPSDEPAGSPAPSSSGTPTALRFGDEVEVVVDGLAVRRSPFVSSPLAVAMATDEGGDLVPAGDVRLDAGYRLFVELGPIVIDGITWYQVYPGAQPGETDLAIWDADADGEAGDSGWIAGVSESGDAYLSLIPADPNVPIGNRPLVEAGGEGNFTSEPFIAGRQVVGRVALATNGSAPCDLRIVLQPTGEVLYETSLMGAFDSGRMATSGTETLPDGEYTLEVTAGVPGDPDVGCPWTLTLFQAIG